MMEEYNSVTEYMYTGFWWESLKKRDRLVKKEVDGERGGDNIKTHFIN
jgi:hypothetical protein